MMGHDTAILLGTVALVAALAALSPQEQQPATADFYSSGEKVASLTLEVADTREERKHGLMNRASLAENQGMLFIFPHERERTFWMKNTYIPLDIIFIAENGTIVDIDQADPQPNASDSQLKLYRSDAPAKYVIEANQGFVEEHGGEVGDIVEVDY